MSWLLVFCIAILAAGILGVMFGSLVSFVLWLCGALSGIHPYTYEAFFGYFDFWFWVCAIFFFLKILGSQE